MPSLRARTSAGDGRGLALMSASSCSVSMITCRWLRRFSGLTSIGSADASSLAACGPGRRSVTVGEVLMCGRGSALSLARTKT